MATTYQDQFEEYLIFKKLAAKTKASIQELRKLSDRTFRAHLMSVYADGHPLSEISHYLDTFYSITVTPQQLKRILKLTGGPEWNAAEISYRQHHHVRKQERLISAMGE